MSGTIGASSPQVQSNIIQNSVQQNAQRSVQREAQGQGSATADTQQAAANQDFVQLAQDIIAQRATGGDNAQQATTQRGQVLDLLV